MKQTVLALSITLGTAFGLSAVSGTAHAEELSVDEIVKRTNQAAYYQGDNSRATVSMTIIDSQKRKRTRSMTILRRNSDSSGGDQSFYVHFHAPSDVARTVFMVHKHVGDDDDRWLYIPGLDLVNRIAAGDKRTSFVGSDFVYEDISGRDLSEDHHKLLKTTKSYYLLENTPKKPKSVEFSRYRLYIHKKTFLPTKAEFFDKRGKKYRVMTVDAVKKIQGFHTATKVTMKDLSAGTTSTLKFSNVKYKLDLPKRIFSERYLRRPPVKHLAR